MSNEFQYRATSSDDDKIKGLKHKLSKIEQTIQALSDKGMNNHVVIEDLTLENPVLEKLTFRLDKLQSKDLSGAMNLGNNFGVAIGEKVIKKTKKSKPSDEQPPSSRD